jgi:ribosomal protein S18 acetylase RimI-like enzyme
MRDRGLERAEHDGPADLAGMQELAQRVFPVTGYRSTGDLAWNYALAYDEPSVHRTALWRDNGQVAAWGWLGPPADLMLQVDPAYPGLAGEVVDWAERIAAGSVTIDLADTEIPVTGAVRQRGYTEQAFLAGGQPAGGPGPGNSEAPFFACLSRSLTGELPLRELPAGYRIRPVGGGGDPGSWATVHCRAFPGSKFDAARRRKLATVPPYRADLDLVAEAPDGTFAAYCLGWFDERNATGEFEPVGAHPGHRRRGLAAAVSAAMLRQFRAAGGRRAVVNARGDAAYPVPKRLYESLGFREHTRTRTYRRPG